MGIGHKQIKTFAIQLVIAVMIVTFGVNTTVMARGAIPTQAEQTKKKDKKAKAMNIAMMIMFMAMCFKKPPNIAACMKIPPTGSQAGADGAHAGFSGLTKGTAFQSDKFNDSDPNSGDPEARRRVIAGNGLNAGERKQYDDALDKLKDMGIDYNKDSGDIDFNGKRIPASVVNSGGDLSQFGVSSTDIAAVDDAIKKKSDELARKYKVNSGSLALGGGGGGSAFKLAAPDIDIPEFDPKQYDANVDTSLNGQLAGSRYAGFTRNLAGDQIGVAGDDIFQMIHRRYRAKFRLNYFLP